MPNNNDATNINVFTKVEGPKLTIKNNFSVGKISLVVTLSLLFGQSALIYTPENVKKIPFGIGDHVIEALPLSNVRFRQEALPFINEETKLVAEILYASNKENVLVRNALDAMFTTLNYRISELPTVPLSDLTRDTWNLNNDFHAMKDSLQLLRSTAVGQEISRNSVVQILYRFDTIISKSNEYRTKYQKIDCQAPPTSYP